MDSLSEPIPGQRCWELLATASVGRLALSVRALPVILPVQYYLTGHRIAACLGHHEIPERSLDDAVIAFSVDSISPVSRSGWSVQVQGRAFVPRRNGAGIACGQPAAARVVEILPATITGCHVHRCPSSTPSWPARRPPPDPARGRDLRALSPQECLDLLEPGGVGRVGLMSCDGMMMLPVNYAVAAGPAVFRTAPDILLAALANASANFEADHVDETAAWAGASWCGAVQGSRRARRAGPRARQPPGAVGRPAPATCGCGSPRPVSAAGVSGKPRRGQSALIRNISSFLARHGQTRYIS